MSQIGKDSRYLGLPTFWGRSKTEAYNFLLEKTLLKLQGWKNKRLTQAGREILIKSEAQAVPSCAMSCFALPQKFCDKLNSIANFWWSGDPESKGVHWASWQNMTSSKLVGGMGFREFRAHNIAMLAKQGWRLIQNPSSLLGQMLKGIYFPYSSFLTAPKGRRPSWAWSSLLLG